MTVRWFRSFAALALLVIVAGTIAFADSPKIESTPAPLPPKPDFSSMKFQLGNWTCSTKSGRRPAAYITTSVTTIDPSGYWMVSKSTNQKTPWFPAATQGTDVITYDADTKRWVDVFSGDLGAYGVTTSPGWSGNTMVWTDALFKPGKDVMAVTPTTLTKVSDTKTTSHNTFQERSSGRWISLDSVCTKNS